MQVAKVRAGSKKDVKVVRKVIDTTKWHHNKWPGNHIFQLINALPQPPKDASGHNTHSAATDREALRVRGVMRQMKAQYIISRPHAHAR